jgi:hypothetical protein
MAVQGSLRSVHNEVVMNAAGAGLSMNMAGMAGDNPYFAFQDALAEGARDSAISSIPVIGAIYDVAQIIGTAASLLTSYFGWGILQDIADAAGAVTGSIGSAFSSPALAAMSATASVGGSLSGAVSDAATFARIVARKADEVLAFVQSRNLQAMWPRVNARWHAHLDAGAVRRYGDFPNPTGGHFDGLQGEYAELNHLNQHAAFRYLPGMSNIDDGLALPMIGGAFGSEGLPGRPHYEFHWSLDSFWGLYRAGGPLENAPHPTLGQYDQVLRQSLKHAGYRNAEAHRIANIAKQQWSHLGASTRFPYIPEPTIRGPHAIGLY